MGKRRCAMHDDAHCTPFCMQHECMPSSLRDAGDHLSSAAAETESPISDHGLSMSRRDDGKWQPVIGYLVYTVCTHVHMCIHVVSTYILLCVFNNPIYAIGPCRNTTRARHRVICKPGLAMDFCGFYRTSPQSRIKRPDCKTRRTTKT